MIWSGNFTAGPNSIQDVQQILESQISTVQTLMTQAEATATQAQTAANALQAQAASLTSYVSLLMMYHGSHLNTCACSDVFALLLRRNSKILNGAPSHHSRQDMKEIQMSAYQRHSLHLSRI